MEGEKPLTGQNMKKRGAGTSVRGEEGAGGDIEKGKKRVRGGRADRKSTRLLNLQDAQIREKRKNYKKTQEMA